MKFVYVKHNVERNNHCDIDVALIEMKYVHSKLKLIFFSI